ncbi:endonuclease III domain-containing protein [bacterium]|nr:endonuclease III domain-containing protein [bacterium]
MDYFKHLFSAYGQQDWWPAETPFEMIIGAILTQNTTWKNVETCIGALRERGVLEPRRLMEIPAEELAQIIRTSGYFNQKTKKITHFLNFFHAEYSLCIETMRKEPLELLRMKLLALHGIGPETADSILLYALDKPVFVVDAYTRRIFGRHGLINPYAGYETIRSLFEENLENDAYLFNEYHALIVAVGKRHCGTVPKCEGCPLQRYLQNGKPNDSAGCMKKGNRQ